MESKILPSQAPDPDQIQFSFLMNLAEIWTKFPVQAIDFHINIKKQASNRNSY